MVRFIAADDVMPVLLPDLPDELLANYLDEMDGFVFQGGVDVSPKSYNDKAIEDGKWPGDFYRDQIELKVLDYAFKHNKPVLGICRGFQIINTYFGGKLYQDLLTENATSFDHRDAKLYDRVNHSVTLEPDSWLHEVYQDLEIKVNSIHHQGVKVLGNNLIKEAVSKEDGIIEGFRHRDKNIWAVQWHPEFNHTLGSEIASEKPILNKFIKLVKKNIKI
jgi:putative glutamine amidotransferase